MWRERVDKLRLLLYFLIVMIVFTVLGVLFVFGYTKYSGHDTSSSRFNRFQDKDDVVISTFGKNEYVCFGSCVCEDEEGVRRISTIGKPAIRGLKYLVASVSGLLAYDLARNHFEEECEVKMMDQCAFSNIQATVDVCTVSSKEVENEKVSTENDDASEFSSEIQPKKKKKKKKEYEYQCDGKCKFHSPTEEETKAGGRLDWNKYKIWEKLRWVYHAWKSSGKCEDMVLEGKKVTARSQGFAMQAFTDGPLKSYCESNSRIEFTDKKGKTVSRPMCVLYNEADCFRISG